jgi:hypothetical protein
MHMAVVIVAGSFRVLGDKNDGVSLRRGDYRPGQGEVENDREDACKLVCTCSENGLANVDQVKNLFT